jgi:hypothetical protein
MRSVERLKVCVSTIAHDAAAPAESSARRCVHARRHRRAHRAQRRPNLSRAGPLRARSALSGLTRNAFTRPFSGRSATGGRAPLRRGVCVRLRPHRAASAPSLVASHLWAAMYRVLRDRATHVRVRGIELAQRGRMVLRSEHAGLTRRVVPETACASAGSGPVGLPGGGRASSTCRKSGRFEVRVRDLCRAVGVPPQLAGHPPVALGRRGD